jgi:hypothetical protein
MDENLHYYKLSTPKIEHNNQNKVICTLFYSGCFNLLLFYILKILYNWKICLCKFTNKEIIFLKYL